MNLKEIAGFGMNIDEPNHIRLILIEWIKGHPSSIILIYIYILRVLDDFNRMKRIEMR